MAKQNKKSEFRIIKCAGCGRYEKQVDSRVVAWYCSDCSFGNGNAFRAQSGKKLVKPASNLKKGTIVRSVFGQEYKILGIGYKYNQTTYYFVVDAKDQDGIPGFLGDYQIISK